MTEQQEALYWANVATGRFVVGGLQDELYEFIRNEVQKAYLHGRLDERKRRQNRKPKARKDLQ